MSGVSHHLRYECFTSNLLKLTSLPAVIQHFNNSLLFALLSDVDSVFVGFFFFFYEIQHFHDSSGISEGGHTFKISSNKVTLVVDRPTVRWDSQCWFWPQVLVFFCSRMKGFWYL